MKIKIVIILLLISNLMFSQSFYLHYSTENNDRISSVCEYKINSFIAIGATTESNESGLILKINNIGEVSKKLVIDSLNANIFLSQIYKLKENEFVINGILNYEKFIFIGIDTNLNVLWKNFYQVKIHPDSSCIYNKSFLDNDSNLIIPGLKGVTGSYSHPFLYKFSSLGDSLFYKMYSSNTFFSLRNYIIEHPQNKNYYYFYDVLGENSKIKKLNNEFSIIASGEYDGVGIELIGNTGTSLFLNDSVILSSLCIGTNPSNWQHVLVRLDTNLQTIDKKYLEYPNVISNTDNIYKSLDFKNINYIYTLSTGLIVNCLDSNLNTRWQKQYTIDDDVIYYGSGIVATTDKGVLIYATGITGNNSNISVIKTDSLGNIPLNIQEEYGVKAHDFVVYPNPASDYLKVFKAVQVKQAEFILYNTAGKVVLQNTLFDNITEMNVSDLPQGVYLYNILENGVLSDEGKVVIE